MPIQPVTGTLSLPVESASDVAGLFDATLRAAREPSPSRRVDLARDLGDHWAFVAGTRPEWFAPLQQRLVELGDDELAGFDVGLGDLAALMASASDVCVDALARRLRPDADDVRERILASIGSEPALTLLADRARVGGGRGRRDARHRRPVPRPGAVALRSRAPRGLRPIRTAG